MENDLTITYASMDTNSSCSIQEQNKIKVYYSENDYEELSEEEYHTQLHARKIYYCEDCETNFYVDRVEPYYISNNDNYICEYCYNYGEYFYCEDCEEFLSGSYDITNDNRQICESCYSDNYFTCGDCEDVFHIDCGTRVDGAESYLCEDCYDKYKEEQNIICSYHDYPRDFIKRQLKKENPEYYIGFELEIENVGGNVSNEDMAKEINSILGEDNFLLYSHDGSLNSGFEIISDPLSKGYFFSNKIQKKLKLIINRLVDNGFESHNPGTCGLHFHFSRDYYSEKDTYKLLLFTETYKSELKTISRRSNYSYCDFISNKFGYNHGLQENKSIDYFKKAKTQGYLGDRYNVVNLNNRKTIEIRIFRGTLNWNSFLSSCEFMYSMVETLKKYNNCKINLNKIIYNKQYPELNNYCKDKNINNSIFLKDFSKDIKIANNKIIKSCLSAYLEAKDIIQDFDIDIKKMLLKENNKKLSNKEIADKILYMLNDLNTCYSFSELNKSNIKDYIFYYSEYLKRHRRRNENIKELVKIIDKYVIKLDKVYNNFINNKIEQGEI